MSSHSIVELYSNKLLQTQLARKLRISCRFSQLVLALFHQGRVEELGSFDTEPRVEAALKFSVNELRMILISWRENPLQRAHQGQLLSQLWESMTEPHRQSYTLSDLMELRTSDWSALETLWKDQLWESLPCDAYLRNFLQSYEISIQHFEDRKLIELCWNLYRQGYSEKIQKISQRAPTRNLLELELGSGIPHSQILEMRPSLLFQQLRPMGLELDSLVTAQIQLIALYSLAPPNLVPRESRLVSGSQILYFALERALEGVVTPIDQIELPDEEDRSSVQLELDLLAEFHQPLALNHYLLLREIPEELLRETLGILRIPMLETLNRPQLLFLACHRQLPDSWTSAHINQRFNHLMSLNPQERGALFDLYQTSDLAVVLNGGKQKIERILLWFFKQHSEGPNWNEIDAKARKLGLVAPSQFNLEEKYSYYLGSLAVYTPVMNRTDDDDSLESFTDRELLDEFGVLPWYQSRTELLEALALEQPQLFRVMDVSKSLNPEESPIDYEDPPEPDRISSVVGVYGWGIPDKFYWLTSNEMQNLLEVAQLSLPSPFPEFPGSVSLGEIQKVAILCKDQELLNIVLDKLEQTDNLGMVLTSNPEWMRLWLRKLVEAGMYMRRWKGPGHPYPLNRAETHGQNNYIYNTSVALKELETLQEDLNLDPVLKRLTVPIYSNGGQFTMNMNVLISDIMKDRFCIRVASSVCITAGVNYLKLLGEEVMDPILGKPVDPTQIDRIQ